jgi:hypothetical protein
MSVILSFAAAPAAAADTITRGSSATLYIAGKPNTPYYIWFSGTSDMSGEPGDQPPVFLGNSEGVVFDPDGGPYVIGSYAYNNGNGRTILDDVCPSSATTSNTRYYAQVTTDEDGFGIIQYTTSFNTKTGRNFPIRRENPANPGEDVPMHQGLPKKPTTAVTTVRTAATPVATSPVVPLVTTTVPSTPATDVTVTTESTVPIPATTKKTPVCPAVALSAVVAAILLLRRIR